MTNPKPLLGQRVLVTRAKHQAKELAARIEELGGSAISLPLIRFVPPSHFDELDRAIQSLNQYRWIIFTSVNGVLYFINRLQELKLELSVLHSAKIAAVGSKTAKALQNLGIEVALTPQEFRNEGVIEQIKPLIVPGDRILLPRANLAREILPIEMKALGAEVTEVIVYETILDQAQMGELIQLLERHQLDIITFTSPSTVHSFMQASSASAIQELLNSIQIACIGPVTAEAVKQYGLNVAVVAEEFTIEGLLEGLIKIASETGGK